MVVISDQQCCVCAGMRISAESVSIKQSLAQTAKICWCSFNGAGFLKNTHLRNKTLASFQKFCLFLDLCNIKGKRLPLQINCCVQTGAEDSPEMFCPVSAATACFYSRPISTVTLPSPLSLSWKLSFGAISQSLKTPGYILEGNLNKAIEMVEKTEQKLWEPNTAWHN